jgi:TPR repeat protein
MTLFNTLKSKSLAVLQYSIGYGLFASGIAGWHKRLHLFAMKQLQRASHKQHPKAQVLMAKLLTYRGETILDKRAGLALLQNQAEQGDPQSQFLLAEALLNAELLASDNSQQTAFTWYVKAAEQGHAMAALRLSKAYAGGGLGLERDEQKAQYWSNKFMQHSQNMSTPS